MKPESRLSSLEQSFETGCTHSLVATEDFIAHHKMMAAGAVVGTAVLGALVLHNNLPEIAAKLMPETDTLSAALEGQAASRQTFNRVLAAGNPNASPKLLRMLAVDEEPRVRTAVAGNAMAPDDVLNSFIFGSEPAARRIAGETARTQSDQILAHIRDRVLAPATLDRIGRGEVVASTVKWKGLNTLRVAVAESPDAPPSVLKYLSRSSSASTLRDLVAKNTSTPSSIVDRLAADAHYEVRLSAASNPRLSSTGLDRALRDEPQVRFVAAGHENLTGRQMSRLAGDDDSYIRTALAGNHRASEPILDRLSTDRNRFVRLGVVGNDATPKSILARMSESDSDPEVRAKALRQVAASGGRGVPELSAAGR